MALRVTTEMSGPPGSPWLCQMHFNGTGSTDAAVAAIAVSDFWDDIKAAIVNDVTFSRSGEVEEFDPETGDITDLHSTDAVAVVGTDADEALPWVTQILVRWRTGVYVAGRERRGRTFIPGISLNGLDNGRVHSSFVALFGTAAGTLAAAPLAIWSRPVYVDGELERAGNITPVASSSVWNQFAELRSRRD